MEQQEPKKATDILLELVSKVEMLLGIIRAQDLNIKVLSNKLNDVLARLDKQQAAPPRIVVETVQTPPAPPMPLSFTQLPAGEPDRTIPIIAESRLPQDSAPQGFRRNSRPETYADKKTAVQPALPPPPVVPRPANSVAPPPGREEGVALVPPGAFKKNGPPTMMPPALPPEPSPVLPVASGQIPVVQRCVDKNGKAIFLADVEIVDATTEQPVFKTRTNGNGKWMAPLGVGSYRVLVYKRESLTKQRIEALQEIHVDGSKSKLELPMMIIR